MPRRLFLQRHKATSDVESAEKDAQDAYGSALGIDPKKGTTSFDERVRKEYYYHTAQYWFVACLANGLLWAQIVIGAALTALGATRTENSQTATIYLGAVSTVIAGLLTYFKSRNQPNRSRQFRQALRDVRNAIDDSANDLAGKNPEEARAVAASIVKKYNDALAEAAANYPDFWITLNDLSKFLPGDKNPVDAKKKDQPLTGEQNDGPKPGDDDEDGAKDSESPSQSSTVNPNPPQPNTHLDGKDIDAQHPTPHIPDPKTHGGSVPKTPEKKQPPSTADGKQPPTPHHDASNDLVSSEKDIRDIAAHIDIDKDFSHPDDDNDDDKEEIDEHHPQQQQHQAPKIVAKAQGDSVRAAEPVAVRRVGGFVLLA